MQQSIQNANQILQKVNLPIIPEEVIRLKEEINKKYPNTVTIANLISHHPELLANFLDLVKTNLTDEKQEIKDARAAVNILGLEDLYNLFLSSVLTNIISESDVERMILNHGAKAGIAAAELSYWVQNVSRSEAYMAGLMQNIGAVYLSRLEPEYYAHLFNQQLAAPLTAYQKELEHFETAHTFVGIIVAKRWHLESDIYKAILLHHDIDFANETAGHAKVKNLVSLVILANYVVSATTGEQYITQESKQFRDRALEVLDLPRDRAIKAASSAVQKFGNKVGVVVGAH
ncbi:HDOD domain-containing protein [Galenea microaerophila]